MNVCALEAQIMELEERVNSLKEALAVETGKRVSLESRLPLEGRAMTRR